MSLKRYTEMNTTFLWCKENQSLAGNGEEFLKEVQSILKLID